MLGHASIAITKRAYVAATLTQPNLAGPVNSFYR